MPGRPLFLEIGIMRTAIALAGLVAIGGAARALDVSLETPEVVLDTPPLASAVADTTWLISENFDASGDLPGGWASVDYSDVIAPTYWHVDDRNTYDGSGAWWCGTYGNGWTGYGNMWRQQLDLTLDLSSATGITGLTYWQYFDSEWPNPEPPDDTWDGGTVRVSTDGGTTWTVITPQQTYPYNSIYAFFLQDGVHDIPGWSGQVISAAYEQITFNLTPYVGGEVLVRFDFASDKFASDEDGMWEADFSAWFIDDVIVGNTSFDIYFEDDMEGAMKPEWNPHAGPITPSGDWWDVVDDSHPQPDGRPVYVSAPNALFVGDPASSQGDGTYYADDHALRALDNGIELPSLDLSGDPDMETAEIRWQERMKRDGAGGYQYFEVSTDGGTNWQTVEQRGAPGGTFDWEEMSYSLNAYIGQSDVRVRLRAGTGTLGSHHLYWYVDDVEVFYTKDVTGIGGDLPAIGAKAALHDASPNPFNPRTRVSFTLAETADVSLQVFDISGRLVRTLLDGQQLAGDHSVSFDGRDNNGAALPSGVYTARLVTGETVQTTRLLMLK